MSTDVKREQRKSFFLKEISKLIRDLSGDEPMLLNVFPTRVEFSEGDGVCYVYFDSHTGKAGFDDALEVLTLYKPSLRKALASIRHSRYTPDIKFMYDISLDKSRRVNELLDEATADLDKKS